MNQGTGEKILFQGLCIDIDSKFSSFLCCWAVLRLIDVVMICLAGRVETQPKADQGHLELVKSSNQKRHGA